MWRTLVRGSISHWSKLLLGWPLGGWHSSLVVHCTVSTSWGKHTLRRLRWMRLMLTTITAFACGGRAESAKKRRVFWSRSSIRIISLLLHVAIPRWLIDTQLGTQPLDLLIGCCFDTAYIWLGYNSVARLLSLRWHGWKYVPILLFKHLYQVLYLYGILCRCLLLELLLLSNRHIRCALRCWQKPPPTVTALPMRKLLLSRTLLLLTATGALVKRGGLQLIAC
jgi:hypothetical protein